ncbi:hypothetical protein [Caulobacter segnis]
MAKVRVNADFARFKRKERKTKVAVPIIWEMAFRLEIPCQNARDGGIAQRRPAPETHSSDISFAIDTFSIDFD